MFPPRCKMSACRKSEVTSVQTLPLSKLLVLKAKKPVFNPSESAIQTTTDTSTHARIIRLILFTANRGLEITRIFSLSQTNLHPYVEISLRKSDRIEIRAKTKHPYLNFKSICEPFFVSLCLPCSNQNLDPTRQRLWLCIASHKDLCYLLPTDKHTTMEFEVCKSNS